MARKAAPEREITTEVTTEKLSREFLSVKVQEDALKKRREDIKPRLFEKLIADGEEDDKGNITFPLPSGKYCGYSAVQRQIAIPKKRDDDECKRILQEKGLWETCAPLQPVLDDDAIARARWDEKLTDDDLALMYPRVPVYRLVAKK